MVGRFILYYAGSRNTAVERSSRRRREWRVRGSAAAGLESKSPHQQRTRRPRQFEIESYAVPNGRSTKEDPAARKESPQVGEGSRGGCRFSLAGRILPLKKFSFPNKIYGPRKSLHIPGLYQGSKDRGRSKHTVLRGCAKNRRKTRGGLGERRRQPLFGEQRSGEEDTERAR